MLEARLRAESPDEIQALWFLLGASGCEVSPRTRKQRDEGFTDQYGLIRIPDEWLARWRAAGSPTVGPVRAQATIDRPALPGGERQLRGRRGRR